MAVKDACRLLGGGRVRAAGSGAVLLREEAALGGVDIVVANDSPSPDILAVAGLGLAASPENAPARPIYLKPPDARPAERRAATIASP